MYFSFGQRVNLRLKQKLKVSTCPWLLEFQCWIRDLALAWLQRYRGTRENAMSTGTFWKVRKGPTSTAVYLQIIVFQIPKFCSVIFMAHHSWSPATALKSPLSPLFSHSFFPVSSLTFKSYCIPIINSWTSFSFFPWASSSFFYQVFSAVSSCINLHPFVYIYIYTHPFVPHVSIRQLHPLPVTVGRKSSVIPSWEYYCTL